MQAGLIIIIIDDRFRDDDAASKISACSRNHRVAVVTVIGKRARTRSPNICFLRGTGGRRVGINSVDLKVLLFEPEFPRKRKIMTGSKTGKM